MLGLPRAARPGNHRTKNSTEEDLMTPRRIAIALISAVGLIHLFLAPDQLEEKAYVGALFLLGAAGCAVTAVLLGRNAWDRRAWALGSLISVGMFAGFIVSRTVGLPGFHESEWEISGIITLILEACFVGLAIAQFAPARQGQRQRPIFAGR
jgi:drug/metabolite transporter (DMT)-like permease